MEFNRDFIWSSDWDGEEVGFPESSVVGLYNLRVNPDIYLYIDMETLEILDAWATPGEEGEDEKWNE